MAKIKFELKGDKELIAILKKMDYRDMQRVYKKALTDSIRPLVNETKKMLRRSNIKNVNKPYIGKNGKTYKSMIQGIKSSIDVRDPKNNYAKAHIMGEFRLKWFEKGTALRKTNDRGERGRIRPYRFFRDSIERKGGECENMLETNIRKSIQRVWERK